MKFVVDTNILFGYFWKQSVFKTAVSKHEFISPKFSLEELKKYKEEICAKVKCSPAEFDRKIKELQVVVLFVPLEQYEGGFSEAVKVVKEYPAQQQEVILQDIDFFALSLVSRFPIWSNDKLMKKQDSILVFSTSDIIAIL